MVWRASALHTGTRGGRPIYRVEEAHECFAQAICVQTRNGQSYQGETRYCVMQGPRLCARSSHQ
jgi:hypothetical protein